MDRRAFVGNALGSVALGLSPTAAAAADAGGDRPSFAVTPDGLDRWRVRSWDWRDGAWRPRIARLIRTDSRFRLEGRVAAADRPALAEWIGAQSA
ncbi:hypothetical protein IAG41_01230 [Sphingomonas sp. JC676]|uniref:hypothetical protein n=1 Tax=Sphingomonas sp. JC676 TaxID=2768065 RepID=UPI0016584515|nr:hypothetical protein [Sphingomonas sp. JC676]MBC9031004.1 hypothetical protein [Sphingomonas sp. JC676]